MPENGKAAVADAELFEDFSVRKHYDAEHETWYFSVIDVVAVLTDQRDYTKAKNYWYKLSQRLREEGSETLTNCQQLKMKAQDGKMRLTDAADMETLLRITQSVPSKKAEPVKLWLGWWWMPCSVAGRGMELPETGQKP